jgi:serine/threonine protein kinase
MPGAGLFVHQSRSGYDGSKHDIWSMGVLMVVMLLRAFPFDFDIFLTLMPRQVR